MRLAYHPELLMTSPLNVAILAAGQGKRMHSALPKVLHPLAGRSLIAHVLAAARELAPRAVVIVIVAEVVVTQVRKRVI